MEKGAYHTGQSDMEKLNALIYRLETIERTLPQWVQDVLTANRGEILYLQSEQLMDGKASDGNDIRPYYSEDSYFQTRAQMEWYRNWKQQITPNPNRNPDAPNLYIDGTFHSELAVMFDTDGFTVDGGTAYAKSIVNKYGIGSFGLTDDNLNRIYENVVAPYLMRMINETLI